MPHTLAFPGPLRGWLMVKLLWSRSRRVSVSKASMPRDNVRRTVQRRWVRRTAAGGAIASALILSSCGGSSSGSPMASATTSMQFQSLPNDAAGTQLRWVLSSVADAPLPAQEINSHFDAAFLTKFPPAAINTVLARLPPPGKLVGVESSGPIGLVAVANFGGTERWTVTVSVETSGLIQELLFTPSASAAQ
jgi:hypothetical protein